MVNTNSDLEEISEQLDTLRGELMMVISSSRDQRELTEKIFSLSKRYQDMPELMEFILYLNSILSTDIKAVKESLIKAIDSIIIIKKGYLKHLQDFDNRLSELEKNPPSYKENTIKIGSLEINPWVLYLSVISIFLVLFLAFSINDKAAEKSVNAMTTLGGKIKGDDNNESK
jgi:hypothetical protein